MAVTLPLDHQTRQRCLLRLYAQLDRSDDAADVRPESVDQDREDAPVLTFTCDTFQPQSRKAWREWLKKHHASSPGIWLVYAKKHTGIPSLSYNDAVEEALCYGWIDSLIHPIDQELYKQIFTPRKPKSAWSAANKARVERLIAGGLMTAAGMALVALAKKSGRWSTLDQAAALTMPPELQ